MKHKSIISEITAAFEALKIQMSAYWNKMSRMRPQELLALPGVQIGITGLVCMGLMFFLMSARTSTVQNRLDETIRELSAKDQEIRLQGEQQRAKEQELTQTRAQLAAAQAENNIKDARIKQDDATISDLEKRAPPAITPAHQDDLIEWLKDLGSKILAAMGKDILWNILKAVARFFGWPF